MSNPFPFKSSYSAALKTSAEPEQERMEESKGKGRTVDLDKSNRSENRRLTPGSIFIGEHYEGAGDRSHFGPIREDGVTADGITTCASHSPIVIKDRKLIVLFVHTYQYVCIPLFTYQKDGANSRADEDHHVSVADCRGFAPSTVQQSHWKPLRTRYMTPQARALAANTAARVTFPISRPKNLPIEVLGVLGNESIERLKELFIVLNDLAPNEEEKTRLEMKHKDPTWTGTPSALTMTTTPTTTTTTTLAANVNISPPPGPGLSTTSSLFGSGSPEARPQRPYGSSWRPQSSGQSASSQSREVDWGRLGQRRADAASRSQGSQSDRGAGGDSASSDPDSGGNDPSQTSSKGRRRARRTWRPLADKIGMKAPVRSSGPGKEKKKKRKAGELDDDAGENECEQPKRRVRRSGRKRTKVAGYAE